MATNGKLYIKKEKDFIKCISYNSKQNYLIIFG